MPAQIRMARAALGISVRELAQMAAVGDSTIVRFETGKGGMLATTLHKLQHVLESKGVVFVSADTSGGPGVRLKA